MKNILLALCILITIGFTAEEKKGQRYYLKQCSSCHGNGNRGGNLATIYDWKEYFKNDAQQLKDMHSKQEHKALFQYFASKKFEKNKKYMLRFLIEFAKDSHKIPSCNN